MDAVCLVAAVPTESTRRLFSTVLPALFSAVSCVPLLVVVVMVMVVVVVVELETVLAKLCVVVAVLVSVNGGNCGGDCGGAGAGSACANTQHSREFPCLHRV